MKTEQQGTVTLPMAEYDRMNAELLKADNMEREFQKFIEDRDKVKAVGHSHQYGYVYVYDSEMANTLLNHLMQKRYREQRLEEDLSELRQRHADFVQGARAVTISLLVIILALVAYIQC